mmetsp:Transcript_2831/g.4278  ORF Transcript_2831/g.4278 Transcript_2831/m.4278 type:complete len:80 (+) Transcript_2831:106-345(+)
MHCRIPKIREHLPKKKSTDYSTKNKLDDNFNKPTQEGQHSSAKSQLFYSCVGTVGSFRKGGHSLISLPKYLFCVRILLR